MASNYTTNYQLNQWEPTDQVLRTDFNADNVKIEQAILSRLGPVEIIQQIPLTSSSSLDDAVLDLASFDWSQWTFVAIEFIGNFSSNAADRMLYIDFMAAGLSGYPGSASELAPKPQLVVLFPCRDAGRTIRLVSFPGGKLGTSIKSYGELTTVNLAASYASVLSHLQGSGSMTLYGIR